MGIVGAGVAGLQVARRLHAAGASVVLFDKARGPSGRVATRRSDFGQFDHGAQYFTARDPRFQAQVEDWLSRGVVQTWTGKIVELEAGRISPEASASERFVGTPKMSILGRDLLGELPIELSARVIGVEKQGDALTLQIADGESQGGFDVVVSAVPAPQAEPLLQHAPALAAEAAKVTMLPCHAAMLTLAPGAEAAFKPAFDAAFIRGSGLSWAARNASKPGRGPEETWVLHSQPEWSEAHLDLPMNSVALAMQEEFEKGWVMRFQSWRRRMRIDGFMRDPRRGLSARRSGTRRRGSVYAEIGPRVIAWKTPSSVQSGLRTRCSLNRKNKGPSRCAGFTGFEMICGFSIIPAWRRSRIGSMNGSRFSCWTLSFSDAAEPKRQERISSWIV